MPPATSHTAPADGFLSSPRNQRRLLIVSAAVLVAGVVAFTATFLLRGSGNHFTASISNQNAQLIHPDKPTPISREELRVARRFVETAVLRHNTASSYALADPDLKGTMTKKQWATGNIPVIPYPAQNAATSAFQVDYSYQTSALLEIDLVAKPGSGVRPHLLFFLGLKRAGGKPNGKWRVSYWEPHWKPPIPEGVN
jgi:hypothetical protein